MTRKELESMEDAFLLALGSALLGLSSCTNASVFANPVEAKEVPAVKIAVQQKVSDCQIYQMTNSVNVHTR